jgi:signal transduction histidine kinase
VDEADDVVRLTITDGGPGISDADRDRLFTRFERGSTSVSDGGSGLGLYVSRELCRAMGGELTMEPTLPGRGAAFTIELPGEPGDEG